MSCLNVSGPSKLSAFVRIFIKIEQPKCDGEIKRTEFTVTRFLSRELINNIYYDDCLTRPISIVHFHMLFLFVVIEQPPMKIASSPNEFDLMQLWRNVFGLDKTIKMAKIKNRKYVPKGFDEFSMREQLLHYENDNICCVQWNTLNFVIIQKTYAQMKQMGKRWERNESNMTSATQEHQSKCAHFNKTLNVIRMLLLKAIDVSAAKLPEERDLNAKIENVFTTCISGLNARVAVCRESQLFGSNRQNYIRKFKKLPDLSIDANIINNIDERNTAMTQLDEYLNSFVGLMVSDGLSAFHKCQEEYYHLLHKLNKIHEDHRIDRRNFIHKLQRKYDAILVK